MPVSINNNEKIRKNILDKSAQLFLSQGYEQTSIRQIAEVAGMLKGNLYYYFRKKEDILLCLFQDSIKSLYSELLTIIDDVNPFICYAVMIRTYMHILDENRALLKIYIDASKVPTLRLAFFNILNQVFNDLIMHSQFSFCEDKLYISTLASASVEAEMVSQYANGNVSMENVVSTVVRVKLSLLNIEPKTIDKIIETSSHYKLNI